MMRRWGWFTPTPTPTPIATVPSSSANTSDEYSTVRTAVYNLIKPKEDKIEELESENKKMSKKLEDTVTAAEGHSKDLKKMENTNTALESENKNITAKLDDKVTEVEELKKTNADLRLVLQTIAPLIALLNTGLNLEVIMQGMELEEAPNMIDEGNDGDDSLD